MVSPDVVSLDLRTSVCPPGLRQISAARWATSTYCIRSS